MTVMEKIFHKRVNIKFTAKKADLETKASETASWITKKSELKLKVKLPTCNKRKSELVLDVPEEKRCKMDRTVKHHCGVILKELLNHRAAFIFNKPVDPVALNIPDYFSIISDPMDLGTIKSKLENNIYFSAEEFAADVSLTFSNAMLYNPPDNAVHQYAVELNHFFKRRWKFQFASWNSQIKNLNRTGVNAEDAPKVSKKSPSDASFVAKKMNSTDEKQELRKEVMVILKDLKRTEKLRDLLHKFNIKEGEMGQNIAALDVSALKELKKMLKLFLDANSSKVMPAKFRESNLGSKSGKVLCNGGLVNSKRSVSSISSICGVCREATCQCGHQISELAASASSNVSENSSEDGHHSTNIKSQDSEIKISQTNGCVSDHDSDGPGSVLDEDNTSASCRLSACVRTAGSGEVTLGRNALMDDQYLKKALRAAMLKSRFADTIMKASGDKADPRKMHQERERLERLQREEAAKIEARQKEEQLKLKMQREKERQAARVALEKMERTIDLEDNMKFIRELEMLSRCSSSDFRLAFGIGISKETRVQNPLELIGLYLKKDYMDEEGKEEAIVNGEREEGEIVL